MNNLILQSLFNVTIRPIATPFLFIGRLLGHVGRMLGMIHPIAILSRLVSSSAWLVVIAIVVAEVFGVRLFAEYAVSDLGWEPGLILMTVVMPGLMGIVFKWIFLQNWMGEYRSLASQHHPTSIPQ